MARLQLFGQHTYPEGFLECCKLLGTEQNCTLEGTQKELMPKALEVGLEMPFASLALQLNLTFV